MVVVAVVKLPNLDGRISTFFEAADGVEAEVAAEGIFLFLLLSFFLFEVVAAGVFASCCLLLLALGVLSFNGAGVFFFADEFAFALLDFFEEPVDAAGVGGFGVSITGAGLGTVTASTSSCSRVIAAFL